MATTWDGCYETGGRRTAQGCAASNAAAAASTRPSAKRGPTIWRPIGKPAVLQPHGTVMAGRPHRILEAGVRLDSRGAELREAPDRRLDRCRALGRHSGVAQVRAVADPQPAPPAVTGSQIVLVAGRQAVRVARVRASHR